MDFIPLSQRKLVRSAPNLTLSDFRSSALGVFRKAANPTEGISKPPKHYIGKLTTTLLKGRYFPIVAIISFHKSYNDISSSQEVRYPRSIRKDCYCLR